MAPDATQGDEESEAAGVRTFLIADVRGYTRFSETHGDEAASELARQFALVASAAVEARGGRVVELRGDEALCVFTSARAAVRGALELQRRALEGGDGGKALPLGVGIGLDVGEAVPTNGGYRGRALNVAARLCSLAKGGEILASEAVAHLAGQDNEARFEARPPAKVKGLDQPLRFVRVRPKIEHPPAPTPERPRRRSRRTILVATGVVVAVGAAVAAVQLGTGDKGNASTVKAIASKQCWALNYHGAGTPDRLIVADLPLQPGILATTSPMVNAMTLSLERHKYRAGPYRVGLQVCDDASSPSIVYDEQICSANAHEYVANPSVVGVVGPFSSDCAKLEIPILNRASGGAVAAVSPSTTYVGLTRSTPATESDEPGVYYPTQTRNFARVIPADDIQAAADAIVADRLGVKRVFVIHDSEEPSIALTRDFVRAARRLGIFIAGQTSPELPGTSDKLPAAIHRTRADGVFIAAASNSGSVELLRALRAELGSGVQLMAADGFDPGVATVAGAEGMTISVPGPLSNDLGRKGKSFVAAFSHKFGVTPGRLAVNAAQAIDVLLDAIARSDGTRASVTRNMLSTRIDNGILGSFFITATGDTTLNTVAIYRIQHGKAVAYRTITVPDELVGLG